MDDIKNTLETEDRNRFSNYPKTTLFLILLLIFFALLFIFEFLLKSYYPIFAFSDTGEYAILRKYDNNIQIDWNKEPFDVVLRTEDNGYIYPSKVHETPDISIFFFGGSTTECFYVDELKRFPYATGRILEEKLGKKINAFNAGHHGSGSMHSLGLLLYDAIPHRPDYAVLMHNINDRISLLYTGSYWNNSARRITVNRDFSIEKFPQYILEEYFPHLYYRILDVLGATDEFYKYRNVNPDTVNSTGFTNEEQFANSITSFVLLARTWNSKPILMTQFYNPEEKDTSAPVYKNHTIYNDIIRQTADTLQVPLIELAATEELKAEHFKDYIHLNDKGCGIVAGIISDSLASFILAVDSTTINE